MKKILNKKGGFTLIELLVVISIIGLLSSVVLASLSTARDKGRIAAGQTFSSHNYQALGADAYFFYDFNKPFTDGESIDESQYLNPIFNIGASLDNNTPFKSGSSIKVNASGQYIEADLPFYIPNLTLTNHTVSVWVYFTQTPSGVVLQASKIDNSSRAINIDVSANGITFGHQSSGWSNCTDSACKIGADNKWHHIAYSFNGTNDSIYIDGRYINKYAKSNLSTSEQKPGHIIIGAFNSTGGSQIFGYLDDVAIYNSSLASKDIEQIYAQGLPTHTLAENK